MALRKMAEEEKEPRFDYRAFQAKHGGATVTKYSDKQTVYAQGDKADALYYIVSGSVKVTIYSEYGKEAVIGILTAGDFFGEGCVDGQIMRNSSIVTTSECEIARIDIGVVSRALDSDPDFAKLFMHFILDRNQKLQSDMIDQLFNSSEKRLARILLTLANTGLGTQSNTITMAINQEMLATMVGTTRSRVNQFMNKFRKLGYINYNGNIEVNNSLLNLILHDQPQSDHG
jgi:CRP/FNR family transcriptional regulator, cyclic AMP receptor protein